MAELKVQPNILVSISGFYNDDPIRVFFEYIDNSLDNAQDYFDESTNSYKKDILITFDINRKAKEITITDNCDWINDFNVLLTSIGLHQSHWKTDHWQFWYWVFSFPAIAKKIKIISKSIKKVSWETITITMDDIVNWNTKEDPHKVPFFNNWTEITLSDFMDKKFLKSLSVDTIKNRIEDHLEWILWRKNLRIEVVEHWNDPVICTPFDYDQYPWEVYEKYINTPVKKPIRIFLKVIQNKQINRPPFFMVKWREIQSICEITTFKSKNKGTIRKHPNLIWYIDLWNAPNPNMSRNWVKRDPTVDWVFNKIIEEEPEILKLIQNVNKITQNEHYKKLENILTDIVAERMKLDNMRYNMVNSVSWTWWNSAWWEETNVGWIKWEEWFWAQDHNDWRTNDSDDTRSFWTWEWDGIGPNWNPWQDFPSDEKDETWKNKWIIDWDFWWMKTKSKPSFWFPIKFEDVEVPEDEMHRKIRSSLIGWEIIIYKNHPDYIERTKTFANWNDKITQRLITYLAWEITVHIKDSFHNHHTQPWPNKDMFIDLVETIYWFEDRLKGLVDKNLSDLS